MNHRPHRHANQKADAESRNHIEGIDHEHVYILGFRSLTFAIDAYLRWSTRSPQCGTEMFNRRQVE